MTGAGTAGDPYVIWDVDDLQDMDLDLTAYYILGSDIDASVTVGWNGGLGFAPVGQDNPAHTPALRFSGYFDGKGYKIINLVINRPADDEGVGLFGTTAASVTGYIRNVGLQNVDITGEDNVGSLIGFHESMADPADGIISNCWSTGVVKGEAVLVGGFAGYNGGLIEDCWTSCDVIITGVGVNIRENGGFVGHNDRTIRRCRAAGNITCEQQIGLDISEIGGFVGYHNNGGIDECLATGDVLINSDEVALDDVYSIGGFIGDNWGNGIRNCYARGDVTAFLGVDYVTGVGGLIGYNEEECVNCYSTGQVTAAGFAQVGGLVGEEAGAGSATNCFWDTETSGQGASDGGTGKTTAEMKAIATIQAAGWAISIIWNVTLGCNDSYPCLIGVNLCCGIGGTPEAGDKVTLEAIRNIEIVYGGRFYIDKSGNAKYESRYHRNV